MRNRLKTSLLVLVFFLLSVCIVWQIIIKREPVSNSFPLRQAWRTQVNGSTYGISITDDEMVLVRTSTSLYALDANSGKIVWHLALSWQADAKPAIAKNGMVYITDGNSVLALEQKTGSILWKQKTSYSSMWITDVSKSVVLVNQLGIDIIAFDTNSGEYLWRKPVCRGYVHAFTSENNVYIPCDGLQTLDAKSGDVVWTADMSVAHGIDHSQGVVYYFSDAAIAYDVQNQKALWDTAIANTGLESLRVVNNTLFYADDIRLCMLDINNGHLEWCAKTAYPQTPVVIDKNIYIFDGSHKTITAFQTTNGTKIGSLNLSNFNYFIIDRQLLASSKNLLFFANGKDLYAYTK